MLSAEDHLAVINHIARYNHAIDLGTPEEWADCFTDDAEFDAEPVVHCHGRSDLVAFFEATLTDKRLGRHWNSNVWVVDGDGDRATTRVYLMMVRSGKVGEIGNTGVYEDRLVKRDGQWRFEYRKLTFEDPPDWPR